jgi:uncharacterized membrane protein YbhN (UPF0104 family)
MPNDFWWVTLELVLAGLLVCVFSFVFVKPSDEVRITTARVFKRLGLCLVAVVIYFGLLEAVGLPVLAGLMRRSQLHPGWDQNRFVIGAEGFGALLALGGLEAIGWVFAVRLWRWK